MKNGSVVYEVHSIVYRESFRMQALCLLVRVLGCSLQFLKCFSFSMRAEIKLSLFHAVICIFILLLQIFSMTRMMMRSLLICGRKPAGLLSG